MYQPIGLQKIFVQEMKPLTKRKPSNSLIAFFGVAQLCFGFNFGFTNTINGKFKTTIKCITSIMGCVMIVTLFVSFMAVMKENHWVIVNLIQYIPTFFILMSVKYTLCEFISDIIAMNEHPVPTEHAKVGLVTWLYISWMFVFKVASAMIYCLQTMCCNSHQLMIHFLFHIPLLAQDFVPVANYLLLFHVYDQMKQLKIKFHGDEINVDTLINTYKAIADKFDKFRSSHDAIFIWRFVTESPKWIFLIWNYITLVKSPNSWLLYISSFSWALHITVEFCVQAVFAEMINVQTDAMKMILHERMLVEKNEINSMNLHRVLRYIEARSLLYKAWRLLPLDLRLPVTMLSMCTTYLIVIIQFTHLFD